MGVSPPLEIAVEAPGARLETLDVALEQNGKQFPLFTLADQKGAQVKQDGADKLLISRDIGKQSVPELQSGNAAVVVTAARKVVYGIRTVSSTARRDFKVRLERPRVSVVSTHHYINHGGSEMVVYRASPEDVLSGVSSETSSIPAPRQRARRLRASTAQKRSGCSVSLAVRTWPSAVTMSTETRLSTQ